MQEKKFPTTNESGIIIEQLNLLPHPEGGWYREVYRSGEIIPLDALPKRYNSVHNFSTSIYFLLEKDDFSAFHRISSDETWHFYFGSPIFIFCLSPNGYESRVVLGANLTDGQILQFTIKRNCWFAAINLDEQPFSLVGCTVSPGFEFEDFELGKLQRLIEEFPESTEIITKLTRG